ARDLRAAPGSGRDLAQAPEAADRGPAAQDGPGRASVRRTHPGAVGDCRGQELHATQAEVSTALQPDIRRKGLFENDRLQIGLFETRPASDACGRLERQSLNAIVLPFAGLFAKHEAPGRHVTGTPSHAIYFAPDEPYKISFPGGIGDRAI